MTKGPERCNFVISTGVFMVLRPTQGDENRVEEGLVGNYT